MNKIKISVLMPAYNSEDFISKSIESIINQSFSNYELIIVDDGSNDSTKEIIEMYSRKNEKIRVFSKSNSGITESLNYGLKFCEGKWIARIDADDLCHFNRFKKQLLVAESSNKLGLVGSDAIFINKFDKNLFHYSYPSNNKKLRSNLFSCKEFFPHSSAFYDRELVDSLGGYRTRAGVAEDWDLWLRIALKKEIKNINEPLVKIRLHDYQVSQKFYKDQAYDTRIIIIANLLKIRKKYDPIEVFNDDEFYNFKIHIIKSLEKLGFNNFLEFRSPAKDPFLKRLIFPLILLKYIYKPFYIYRFLNFKLFSNKILINIAENFKKKFY